MTERTSHRRKHVAAPRKKVIQSEDFVVPHEPKKSVDLAGTKTFENMRCNTTSLTLVDKKSIEGSNRKKFHLQ